MSWAFTQGSGITFGVIEVNRGPHGNLHGTFYVTRLAKNVVGQRGTRTRKYIGGPEAQFELADYSLSRNGFDAELWLITKAETETILKMIIQRPTFTNSFTVSEHGAVIMNFSRTTKC